MKKLAKICLLILASGLLFTACNKEDFTPSKDNKTDTKKADQSNGQNSQVAGG